MPTSSAMITTMLGFFAVVWADAMPPKARANIANARRLRLIIDASFQLLDRLAGQRMCVLPVFVFLPSARSGPTTTDHALIEKHPKDQQSSENTTRAVRLWRVHILRKFGAPPKIRRSYVTCDVPQAAAGFRHPTDPLDISHGTRGGFHVGSLLARQRL